MDVDLAAPSPVSLDNAIGLLALGLAGYGGYRLFTDVGGTSGAVGWLLVALAWVLVFPRMFLDLRLTDDAVEVDTVTGTHRLPLDEATAARTVDGSLVPRLGGVSTSGYHTGWFHLRGEGRVKAYASRARGPFVLLESDGEAPVVVSPADPDGFVEAVGERAPSVP